MFISLCVTAVTLSGERETIKYAVTKYPDKNLVLQTFSPPFRREFLLLSPLRCVTRHLRNKKGEEQIAFTTD